MDLKTNLHHKRFFFAQFDVVKELFICFIRLDYGLIHLDSEPTGSDTFTQTSNNAKADEENLSSGRERKLHTAQTSCV